MVENNRPPNDGIDDSAIAAETAAIYDGITEEYVHTFWNDRTDAPWLDALVELLPSNGTVLDVGCGPGNFSAYLSQKGLRLHGIDISCRMIETARQLVPGHLFDVADCRRIPSPDENYHGVLAAYSLLHLTREGAIASLHEVFRVLRSGGTLALMLKEGVGSHNLPASLAPGRTCFVQLWDRRDAHESLVGIGFRILGERTAPPTAEKELPFTKFMILAQKP